METGIKFNTKTAKNWNLVYKIETKNEIPYTCIEKLKPKSKKWKTGIQNRNQTRNFFQSVSAMRISITIKYRMNYF